MADLAAIRAAIVATLSGVAGIGRVHDHEPYLKQEARLKELYVTPAGVLTGWQVRRVATRTTAIALGRWRDEHEWKIWGVMALNEDGSSELAFDAIIEAIRSAVRADETLGGAVAGTTTEGARGEMTAGVQVENSLPVSFCGVLCHSATLTLTTTSYV